MIEKNATILINATELLKEMTGIFISNGDYEIDISLFDNTPNGIDRYNTYIANAMCREYHDALTKRFKNKDSQLAISEIGKDINVDAMKIITNFMLENTYLVHIENLRGLLFSKILNKYELIASIPVKYYLPVSYKIVNDELIVEYELFVTVGALEQRRKVLS